MPAFDDLLTAVREDSDQAVLPPAASLRAVGRHRTVRRRGIVAAVLLLLAGGVAVSVKESGDRAPVAARPAVSRYTYLSGRVTVHGQPVAGATIQVIFDPNQDTLSHLQPGAPVPVYEPAVVRTAADGYYQLIIGPTQIPMDFREGDGSSVFDIHIVFGSRTGLWGGGTQPCPTGGTPYWCGDQRAGPLVVDFEMGTPQQVRDDTDGRGTWSGLAAGP